MSEMEQVMEESRIETERLGRSMAASARSRPGFVGAAMHLWELANGGRSASDALGCDDDQAWRLAVTPSPAGANLVPKAMELAAAHGAKPVVLVNMLRLAESAKAFTSANEDQEMLMAALDVDQGED